MFPNLFLVGAPKCGTSALHDYLAGHPDIFMSTPKEPHHFCPDVNAPFAVRDEAAYRVLFKGARERVVGESSATYLVSRVAAQKIYAASPDARIVAVVRNPLEMIPSLHSQRRVNGTEPCVTLAAALEAEPKRRTGELPAVGAFPFYYDAARYTEQLGRYLDVFPVEQVRIIVFDDFKRNVGGVYADLLEFLELSPFTPDFKIVNRNKRVRSAAVQRVVENPASLPNRLPGPVGRLAHKALDRLNSAPGERTGLEPAVREQLKRDFRNEVTSLSDLLGRDLRGWLA